MTAGPIGAGVGAVLGGAGGFISAYNERKQQTRFRRRQRQAIGEAREFADARVAAITGSQLFQDAQGFLEGTFGSDAINSPLARDFATGVRQAQASRGLLFGGAAVSQEASGLAAFVQQQRAGLLPQALQFAQAPEQIRQSVLGFEAPLRVAARTGAALPGITAPQILDSPLSAAFKQAVAGAAGGFQIGSSIDQGNRLNRQLDLLEGQLPNVTPDQVGGPVNLPQRELSAADLMRNINQSFDPFSAGLGTPFEQTQVGRLGGLV